MGKGFEFSQTMVPTVAPLAVTLDIIPVSFSLHIDYDGRALSFAGEANEASVKAVCEALPFDYFRTVGLSIYDIDDHIAIIEEAIHHAPKVLGKPVDVRFEVVDAHVYTRSNSEGSGQPDSVVHVREADFELTIRWLGQETRLIGWALGYSIASNYYWTSLPPDAQRYLKEHGCTPALFEGILFELAEFDYNYGQNVLLPSFRIEFPDTVEGLATEPTRYVTRRGPTIVTAPGDPISMSKAAVNQLRHMAGPLQEGFTPDQALNLALRFATETGITLGVFTSQPFIWDKADKKTVDALRAGC